MKNETQCVIFVFHHEKITARREQRTKVRTGDNVHIHYRQFIGTRVSMAR